MARGVNKVILLGNVGRDPETRYAQNGTAVTRFSIATSEIWKDRSSGEQQERTEWHNIVCFARLAEVAGEYLKKGSKVYIEGQLRTSSWEQDGQKKYRTEVNAKELQMLDLRGALKYRRLYKMDLQVHQRSLMPRKKRLKTLVHFIRTRFLFRLKKTNRTRMYPDIIDR